MLFWKFGSNKQYLFHTQMYYRHMHMTQLYKNLNPLHSVTLNFIQKNFKYRNSDCIHIVVLAAAILHNFIFKIVNARLM